MQGFPPITDGSWVIRSRGGAISSVQSSVSPPRWPAASTRSGLAMIALAREHEQARTPAIAAPVERPELAGSIRVSVRSHRNYRHCVPMTVRYCDVRGVTLEPIENSPSSTEPERASTTEQARASTTGQKPAPEVERDTTPTDVVARFGWLLCLATTALGLYAVMRAQSVYQDESLALSGFHAQLNGDPKLVDRIAWISARSNWLAMMILMVISALAAVFFSLFTMLRTLRLKDWSRSGFALGLVATVAVFFWWHVPSGLNPLPEGKVDGALTLVLSSLTCNLRVPIHLDVMLARLVGEGAAVALCLAAACLTTFVERIHADELARRLLTLRTALYVASVLFVVGVLMVRANFSWVLVHWLAESVDRKAVLALTTNAVLQAGVGYSAVLVLAFVPPQVLLEIRLAMAMSSNERTAWRTLHRLNSNWKTDVQQLLAVLAPLLSAPLFDAIAKL